MGGRADVDTRLSQVDRILNRKKRAALPSQRIRGRAGASAGSRAWQTGNHALADREGTQVRLFLMAGICRIAESFDRSRYCGLSMATRATLPSALK